MGKLTEYKVMLLNPSEEKTKELMGKLIKGTNGEDGLEIAMKAYQTEMGLITGNQPHLFLVRPTPVCVAFTEDFKVFGFMTVGVDPETKTVCVEHAYVRPEVRKKGVFTLMMKRAEKLTKDLKFERMVSFVFCENYASKQAHEKFGYKKRMIGYIKEVSNEDEYRG